MNTTFETAKIDGYVVEFVHDPESKGWSFRVPQLHIVGGDTTRGKAERMAKEAIAFTLEDGPGESRNRGLLVAGAVIVGAGLLKVITAGLRRVRIPV